jgi:hypothetical protein
MTRAVIRTVLLACCVPALSGCFLVKKPDKSNIELRKKNQELESRIGDLQRKSEGDVATIRSLQDKAGILPTLPQDRLAKLFTTHDISLGRLTGGADLDPAKPGDEGLKVYVTPLDESGDPLKAAGSFKIDAFDPSPEKGARVGTWSIDATAARAAWSSVLNRYNYVLMLPWQTPPAGNQLHIDVTFVDELTQREFKKSTDVTVTRPN